MGRSATLRRPGQRGRQPQAGVELLSGDDRFAYAFSSYAESAFPVGVLRYRRGRLATVTREHPALVAADARRQLRRYRASVR